MVYPSEISAQRNQTPFQRLRCDCLWKDCGGKRLLSVPAKLSDIGRRKPDTTAGIAGVLWTKQLYYYDVEQWRTGDPNSLTGRKRHKERNSEWDTLVNFDIISMPDKWEYPWYASWDLSFHCVSLVLVDPDFAKRQLTLMTREWYMHPNGQLPAYEWNFSDTNPPVLAWRPGGFTRSMPT